MPTNTTHPTHYDIFNGDADGICSLIQLRLHTPRDSQLVTGVKRDIALVNKVQATPGDRLTILDISLDKNRDALERCLNTGAEVFYADHHTCKEIPEHPQLETHIHTDSSTCTSLIISRLLEHQYPLWAVAGAFGDNMAAPARALAKSKGLKGSDIDSLRQVGELINYNGYGETLDDLHFHPADLYQQLLAAETPLEASETDTLKQLETGYEKDVQLAEQIEATHASSQVAVYVLPDESWARRISGPLGNKLANRYPERAHAVITTKRSKLYSVSLRAPINNPFHADTIAQAFPSGGGRRRAAGINELHPNELDKLIDSMEQHYRS